jgi:transposase
VFIDEVGFSFLAALGRTWAPCGHPPLLRRVTKERRGFSTIVGLTLSGRIFKRHFKGSIHGQEVVLFLKHLIRHQSGPLILIWDHGSTHRSKKVKAFLADHSEIDIEWLPKYAPEVNPEEVCHGTVKQRLRNLAPSDEAEYRYHVDREFARLRRRPDLVIGFFHHAGLSVKRLW